MVRPILLAMAASIALTAAARASEPTAYAINTVVYQCPSEEPRTFQYVSAHRVPFMSEAKLETQWYWERTRADRGQGCRILSVDGLTYGE